MTRTHALLVCLVVLALLVAGCGSSAAPTPVPAEPTATEVAAAPTQVPATSTPEPPPAADTPEPPTATTEPLPASPTPEPPTQTVTSEPPTATASEEPSPTPEPPTVTPAPALAISTAAFADGGDIPTQYSCFGDNTSPALEWVGVPAETASLALLVYDLDAGAESGASNPIGFAHWIVYNLPADASGLPQNAPAGGALPDGGQQGSNDFAQFESPGSLFPGGAPVKLVGYDGPCPGGRHRYSFTLYALDTELQLAPEPDMTQVLAAMEGHVLDQAAVVGAFAPPQ